MACVRLPRERFLSPWSWLGALLLAGALVVLGHVTADAAGDDAAPGSDLVTTVAATAGVDPVTDALLPAVDAAAAPPLARAEPIVRALAPLPVAGGRLPIAGQPLVRALAGTTMTPLSGTLHAVGDVLPAPVAAVARDVAATLPAPPASAPAAGVSPGSAGGDQPAVPPIPGPAAAGGRRSVRAAAPFVASSAPSGAAAGGVPVPAPSDPNTPWSPGQLPSLPAGGPGAGGSSSVTAGLGAALAWAAASTLLLVLVTLARARVAAPLALRSAMHASRMRRPG
ncbi:MAG TPA: hypothetical protein VIC57_02715 [Candidatus Dormibacteraeota bacterium]|jgi:hypothetical protein